MNIKWATLTPPQKRAKPLLLPPTSGTHSRDIRTQAQHDCIDIEMGLSGKNLFKHKNARFQFSKGGGDHYKMLRTPSLVRGLERLVCRMGVSDFFGTLFADKVRTNWPSCGRFIFTSKRYPRCVYAPSQCTVTTVPLSHRHAGHPVTSHAPRCTGPLLRQLSQLIKTMIY